MNHGKSSGRDETIGLISIYMYMYIIIYIVTQSMDYVEGMWKFKG